MTQDPAEFIVAPSGSIYVAPTGTPEPANEAAALDAAFAELGLVTADGVLFRDGQTFIDIRSWQRRQPTRKIPDEATTQLIFALQQFNQDTIVLAWGGTVEETTTGHWKLTPRAPDAGVDERALVLDWTDGEFDYRIVVPRVTLADAVETRFVHNQESQLPMTLEALGPESGPAWYPMTNNPAWGS